jgi:hypothetical protein
MEEGDLKLIAYKDTQASPGEDPVVCKYQEEAQELGRDKAVPGTYSNRGVQ